MHVNIASLLTYFTCCPAGVLHGDNHQSSVVALTPIVASSSGFLFTLTFINYSGTEECYTSDDYKFLPSFASKRRYTFTLIGLSCPVAVFI